MEIIWPWFCLRYISTVLDSRLPKHQLSDPQLDAVARLFRALSESRRLSLLRALQAGPLAVHELVEICSMKQASVSKHLALLHNLRPVRRRREGVSVIYEIADPVIFAVRDLVCGKIAKDVQCATATLLL
jgi:DNA-binding transcriptional ArsR family regulator